MYLMLQNFSSCILDSSMDSTDAQTYMRQQCSPGYYGPLCSQCLPRDENGLRYGRTSTWSCQQCRHRATIVTTYVASFLLVLLFLQYTVQMTLEENAEEWPNHHASASSLPRVSSQQCLRTSMCAWICCTAYATGQHASCGS